MSKITEELLERNNRKIKENLNHAVLLTKNEALFDQIGMIFVAAGFPPDLQCSGTTISINCFQAKNFKCAEHIIAAFELLGTPAESWKSHANGTIKYTGYAAKVKDFDFSFNIFLGEDSKCKLIEESRETQEVIKYRMECDDD